jgi:hypothetical protein
VGIARSAIRDWPLKLIATARLLAVAIAIGVVAAPALAADSATGRVPTVTRLVKLFLEREDALSAAMRAGDTASLERTLSDDFELRTGARAASPVPRVDFIADAAKNHPASGAAKRMAVHDVGSVAIVSFVQGDTTTAVFVIDVWRQTASDWKLAIRYASPAGPPEFAIPGASSPAAEIPKKY